MRETILEIGCDSSAKGFDGNSCGVNVALVQSPDIAQGVDTAYEKRVESDEDEIAEQGAGDQGLMFGYACTDTPELMPLPIALAHRTRLTAVRKNGTLPYLRPDTRPGHHRLYAGDRVRLDTVVVSSQHADGVDLERLLGVDVREQVVLPEIAQLELDTTDMRLLVNPDQQFRHRWPHGRRGPDRPQDHRGHLRRHGPPRRWRLLGQGPVKVEL